MQESRERWEIAFPSKEYRERVSAFSYGFGGFFFRYYGQFSQVVDCELIEKKHEKKKSLRLTV